MSPIWMEICIKMVLIAFYSWFCILISICLENNAECMMGSGGDGDNERFNSTFKANLDASKEKPFNVISDSQLVADPLDHYHDSTGLSKPSISNDYLDVSKINDMKNMRNADIDKSSFSLGACVGYLCRTQLSKHVSGLFGASTASFQNALGKEHLDNDLSKIIWDARMREMAFNNARNKMSDEEYNAKVIKHLNDKLPKDRLITEEESLKNRHELCEEIIKDDKID